MATDSVLRDLESKVLWLSTWMIHNANHLRESVDGLKVGGHQASSASMVSILTALYFEALRPQDRVAVKPHASPAFHAIQYLFGRISLRKLQDFRAFGGAQSYPSRTKDVDDVDFSTGSVGLGVAQTLFAAFAQDYAQAKGFGSEGEAGRMIALSGDAEMDEGNIFEALLEGWKHDVRNVWWVIDYNRQSLDAVVREGLWSRFEAIFRDFGWDVVILKHGRLQQAAFQEPGGEALRVWIDCCPNQLYCALTYQGGAAWRARLAAAFKDDPQAADLVARRTDVELASLMANLGGHDIPGLIAAFAEARKTDRPTCFIAYTIKGWGLPLAGHKDNHAGLLTPTQVEALRQSLGVRAGHEWDAFEGVVSDRQEVEAAITAARLRLHRPQRKADVVEVPVLPSIARSPTASTQQAFGQILNEIARTDTQLARRIVTAAPDVTVSTNLGPWVNRRGLYARASMRDTFKAERIPSTYAWEFSPQGQHFELGIAEMNLFTLLSALGLSHDLFGERLIPIGTLYDPFIGRALDALNYACYQDARFLIVATPSGITLAPEGGAHQSILTPLIGMAQSGLAAFEPAFVDELAVIMKFAFEYMQRSPGKGEGQGEWDSSGGAVYLRLTTRSIEQPTRSMDEALARDIVKGGYWMRPPGPGTELVIIAMGAVVPEAIRAIGLLAEDRRDAALLVVTSADRLHGEWTAAERARDDGRQVSPTHIEKLLEPLSARAGLVSVLDGHPATLGWVGSVRGHRMRTLGVDSFGQSGSLADLYQHHAIDARAIMRAAQTLCPGRPLRLMSFA